MYVKEISDSERPRYLACSAKRYANEYNLSPYDFAQFLAKLWEWGSDIMKHPEIEKLRQEKI